MFFEIMNREKSNLSSQLWKSLMVFQIQKGVPRAWLLTLYQFIQVCTGSSPQEKKLVGLIKRTEIEERDFTSTGLYVRALCFFIFGRSLRKMCVCVCLHVCVCIHTNTKRLFWNLLSKIDLLNNHPLYNFEQFICNFFSKIIQ